MQAEKMCWLRFLLLTGLLFNLCLVSPAHPLSAAAPAQQATPTPTVTAEEESNRATDTATVDFAPLDQTLARLDRVKRAVARLQRQLDQSQTDIAALAFSIDGNPQSAIDWVRNQIAFEQYPGELRGAKGTLLGQAGNALDTSLLLAVLLETSGYQVRIARATLDEDDARTLINQMAQPRPALSDQHNNETVRKLMVDLGVALGLSKADAASTLAEIEESRNEADPRIADAQADSDFILDALANANIELGDPDAIDKLVAEATDYFWVEYRLSASQPWQSAHPAFKAADAEPQKLRASERFSPAEVPAQLQHRIRIQVEIEQKIEDQLQTTIVMPAWERPAADLVGKPLVYRNSLVGLNDLSALLDLKNVLNDSPIFVPSFNNELLFDGQAFDLNGMTYDPSLAGNDVFKLSQNLNSALEKASGLLDSLGSEESEAEVLAGDQVTLSGQWIDYTLIAPDGTERTVRRTILDRIGAENRAAGTVEIADGEDFPNAAVPLLTQYTILVMPAEYNNSYVAERYLQQLKQQLDLLDYLRKQMPFGDKPISPPLKLLTASSPLDDVVLNALFASYPQRDAEQLSYRAEPYLIVLEDGMKLNGDTPSGILRVDVVNNVRRSFTLQGERLSANPTGNLLAGTWETHAETSPFAAVPGRQFSTLIAFASAAQMNADVQVIRPEDAAQVDQLDISIESTQAIARDLAAGYVVIVPETSATNNKTAGWWRVNPQTGETLGLAEDGRGSSATEYSFLVELRLNLILGAPSTLLGFALCMSGSSGSAGCCMADAAVAWGGGAALGAAVAYKAAAAAIFLGEALKIGGIVGGITGKTPSFCN